MIDVNVKYESHVGARLLDFFGSTTPWHRSLWTLGLVLTLNELLEVTEAVRRAILRQNSVEDLSRLAMSLAGTDPGAEAAEQRRTLQAALRTELRYQGMDYRVVQQLVADIEPKYLSRWAASLRTDARAKPERTARAIAGHLLDAGFSADFLHRWWSYKLRYEPEIRLLADIVEDAHALALKPSREYEVLVAFSAFTKRHDSMPAGWLDAPDVSQWLRKRNVDVS